MSALALKASPAFVHATAVLVGEDAVIVRGASGTGKSALALALIDTARRDGLFACLVGDDRVQLRYAGGRLIVAPHPLIAGQIERRFVGPACIAHEPEAVLRLVVDLAPPDASAPPRLPAQAATQAFVAGVRLARLVLPCAHTGAVEAILNRLRMVRDE